MRTNGAAPGFDAIVVGAGHNGLTAPAYAVLLTYLQEVRDAWPRARLTGLDARVAHIAVDFLRPLVRRDGTAVVR
jgi:hypothetical protein